MKLRAPTLFLIVIFFSAIPSHNLCAQNSGGGLSGTVTSPSATVVPDAKVSAKNLATGQIAETRTNSYGAYQFGKTWRRASTKSRAPWRAQERKRPQSP